jgi:hypothetical protein
VSKPVLVVIEPPEFIVVVPATRICAEVEETVPLFANVDARKMFPVVEETEVPTPTVTAPVTFSVLLVRLTWLDPLVMSVPPMVVTPVKMSGALRVLVTTT